MCCLPIDQHPRKEDSCHKSQKEENAKLQKRWAIALAAIKRKKNFSKEKKPN